MDRCQPGGLEMVKLATEVFVEDYADDIQAVLKVLCCAAYGIYVRYSLQN